MRSSSNPAFRNLSRGSAASGQYGPNVGFDQRPYGTPQGQGGVPGYGPGQMAAGSADRPMTVDDVVVKTGLSLGTALVFGIITTLWAQTQLVTDQTVDLTDPATLASYTANLTTGKAASRAVIDGVLGNGTPGDLSDDFDAVLVPTANALINVADRAGYPALTIPAGYGTGSTGRNPIGVTLVGTAYSEAKLLADGYAFEQATQVRLAPSWTNPSMWRCVPGSTFFTGQFCNPGDRLLRR